jgi:type 1 fimbria pilin
MKNKSSLISGVSILAATLVSFSATASSQEDSARTAILNVLSVGTYQGTTAKNQACKVEVGGNVDVSVVVTTPECIDSTTHTIRAGCMTSFLMHSNRDSVVSMSADQQALQIEGKVDSGMDLLGSNKNFISMEQQQDGSISVRVADHKGFFGYPKKYDLVCTISQN